MSHIVHGELSKFKKVKFLEKEVYAGVSKMFQKSMRIFIKYDKF